MKLNKTFAAMIAASAIASAPLSASSQTPNQNAEQPNIIFIMVDDMGWTDLSTYGSEIQTPNIDQIAHEGIQFSDFHASVSCSPTRAMMMTSVDNHQAGLGNMSEILTEKQKGKPGYEGHLNKDVVTLPEVLKDNGYHTYMAGKWHLGHHKDSWPYARGFERSFSMLYGGASHWADMYGLMAKIQEKAMYVRDDKQLTELPKDFYSSTAYTDELIDYIREGHKDGKPFFGYLAFTAPHDPLHAPEPWLSQYKGQYDAGYEALKHQRVVNAKALGLVDKHAPEPQMHPMVTPWNALSQDQKAIEIRAMETYAGMVSNVDYNVGRLHRFLKDINEYENTIFVFMSDNGANPWFSADYPFNAGSSFMAQFDNSAENIGRPMSHYAYGIGWASASNGPLDRYKMTVGEGGIRVPFLISGPGIEQGKLNHNFAYVTDIMPTILDYADVVHPSSYNGRPVHPMQGKSMKAVLQGNVLAVHSKDAVFAGEMGMKGKWARQGDFKAACKPKPYGNGEWQLFNLAKDPGETQNLAQQYPEKQAFLKAQWQAYAERVGVVE